MKTIIDRHRALWSRLGEALHTLASMVGLLLSSFVVLPYAVEFATDRASNSVTDIILSNIRVYDVDGFFVYGMFLLIAVVTVLCILYPNRIAFTLNALSLFIIIRCVFVSLTHLAPFAVHASDFGPSITRAFFGADLFFSGHTGAPFLMALIYWHKPLWRWLFLAWSVFFGIIVLLGHYHYSIDVLAAFFITYGIFHLALWLFPREWVWFRQG